MSVEEITVDDCCDECIHFKPSNSGTHGYCRRFPPVFTSTDDAGRPRFYSPVVSPWGLCGEFDPVDD
jgi:hypothetical protein